MTDGASPDGFRHELIPLEDRGRWEAALRDLPHAFGHTWAHCHAFWLSSGLPTLLYHGWGASGRVACPLSVRSVGGERDVVTPYGFAGMTATGPVPGFREAWRRFAATEGWVCAYLQGNPLLPDPLEGEDGVAHTAIYVLDLTRSDEELLASMSGNRRRGLRAFQAEGVDIVPAEAEAADFLIRNAPDFFAERSASSLYAFAEGTWRQLLASPGVVALEARRGDETVAVTVFGRAGGLADYLFNISVPTGRSASASLLWEGARRLRADGGTTLNLGGGIRPDDDVAAFKRRFGARPRPLVSHRQIFRADVFEALCRQAGVRATTDGFFPPYHSRSGS